MNKSERALQENDLHHVWFDFREKFWPFDKEWKQTGISLLNAVEVWAKNYPDDVRVVTCDDDVYATSLLILIEHRRRMPGREHHMGTSVVFIPQCASSLTPSVFFLYPHARGSLIRALQELARRATPKEAK